MGTGPRKKLILSSSQSAEGVKERRGLVRVCDTGGITLKEMCSKTCHDKYNHTGSHDSAILLLPVQNLYLGMKKKLVFAVFSTIFVSWINK